MNQPQSGGLILITEYDMATERVQLESNDIIHVGDVTLGDRLRIESMYSFITDFVLKQLPSSLPDSFEGLTYEEMYQLQEAISSLLTCTQLLSVGAKALNRAVLTKIPEGKIVPKK